VAVKGNDRHERKMVGAGSPDQSRAARIVISSDGDGGRSTFC
jgi:hypothetical protein